MLVFLLWYHSSSVFSHWLRSSLVILCLSHFFDNYVRLWANLHFISCSEAETLSLPCSCSHYLFVPQSTLCFSPGFLGWPFFASSDLAALTFGSWFSLSVTSALTLPDLYFSTTDDVSFAELLHHAALYIPVDNPSHLWLFWLLFPLILQ